MQKKPKKKSTTWFRKKCVAWAKEEARKRDKYTCQHCGRARIQGWQIHGSHIKPEGTYIALSADPENIIALCARCHVGGAWKNAKEPSWHEDPLYFVDWLNRKYPGLKEKLDKKAQDIQVVNWEKRWQEINRPF